MKQRKWVALLLVLSTLVALFPAWEDVTTAEAALTSSACPFGGKANRIGYAGCSYCGGKGRWYKDGPNANESFGYDDGDGYQVYPTYEIDEYGNEWELHYRCENCGDTGYDCKKYTELIEKVCVKVNEDNEENECEVGETKSGNGGKEAQGYVPIRWCSACGQILYDAGDFWETVATWAQYHIEEEMTKTYTVTVVASPVNGGMAGDGGIYDEGTTISLWYAANDGYTFAGWSGGIVTDGKHTVTADVTLMARFVKKAVTPEPTKEPKPTAIVLPKASPTPLPTKVPRPFEVSEPISVPDAVPQPTPVVSTPSDIHEDICYVGEKHTCILSSCYTATCHTHSSACKTWYISGSTTCATCKGQNNAGFYSTCIACNGSGSEEVSCPVCGGDGEMTCTTCHGTGSHQVDCGICKGNKTVTCSKCSSSGACKTCGGDGKVSGKCKGTITDTTTHGYAGIDTDFMCTWCRGTGGTVAPGDCGYCHGAGYGSKTYCSCGGYTISGAYGADKACTHSYKCASCGASASTAGTCTKTVANKAKCTTCSGSGNCTTCSGNKTVTCVTCSGAGKVSKSCPKMEACTGCGGDGKLMGQCPTCTGAGKTWAACTACSGSGEVPVWSYYYNCGKTTSYVEYYTKVCEKVNGAYYYNGVTCSPVCHKVVTALMPLYPKQTLQIGESPDLSAYATFISTEGTHGDYPVRIVTCSVSGFNASLYNTWQTVTLSYGTYSGSAKNARPKTTTIQVYVAGEFTVTFDANGGTCSTKSKTVTYGKTYGTLPVASRENYAFYGWLIKTTDKTGTAKEREVTKDSIVATAADHTLTAAWISLEQTVNFDPNGGSCAVKSKTVVYGKPYGTLPVPTRAGYTFAGWWYGDTKKDADSLVEGYDNHTLVAGWIPNTYTITFDAGRGSCTTKTMQVQTDGTANNAAAPLPTLAGYTPTGWYTAVGQGGIEAEEGERVFDQTGTWCAGTYWKNGKWSYLGNLTVYAKWTPNTYTVTLNGMGATTLPQTSVDIVYEKLGETVKKPSRIGYTFAGFYMKPKGNGVKIYNSMGYGRNPWTTPRNGMVYAHWIPITYTVEVAREEIRVMPVTVLDTSTVSYDEVYTVPSALEDKRFMVAYDLMPQTTGSSTPSISLTAANTEAVLTFVGWQLFEKSGTDYRYVKLYAAGTKVQGLSSVQGAVLTLFPYWSGSSATVHLPLPVCRGYYFVGWGLTAYETTEDSLLHIEEGVTATYKPMSETDRLYAYWKPETYQVILDGRGATKQEQTYVTMQYDKWGDKNGNGVKVPEKTGYTFGGYFTGTKGSGMQYFDKDGAPTAVWKETEEKCLYAYWIQDVVSLPEKDAEREPEIEDGPPLTLTVACEDTKVWLYADDNDPATGAYTDIEPYLVSDVVENGEIVVEGAIPSTENIAIRASVGAWMFAGIFEKRSGVQQMRAYVTVPYRTQYEDAINEELIISEVQTKTVAVMVPKVWSYWTFMEGGIYTAEKVVVENAAINGGRVELPVVWEDADKPNLPSYAVTSYGDGTSRFVWNTYDTDGMPKFFLTLTKEEYIISDIPGEPPEITEYLTTVCHNAAWSDTTELFAKSDNVSVAGIELLREEESSIYLATAVGEQLRQKIPQTDYHQTYKSGISLLEAAANGKYETTARVAYKPVEQSTGKETWQYVAAQGNEIKIHTPVVCNMEIVADHEDVYQCESIPDSCTVLVLDEDGTQSDFVLGVDNEGLHSEKKGYGEQSYAPYLAKKDGVGQNEVRFPFAVWVDIGNDKEQENDVLLEAGEWYVLGGRKQRFYIPVGTKEGIYTLEARSVAVNGVGREEKTEERKNACYENYVATGTVAVYLTGRLYGFTVYDVKGNAAWEELEETLCYTVEAQKEEIDGGTTLPLRKGVHPYYKNIGGVPAGGEIFFRLKSIGSYYGEGTKLTILPHLLEITEDGYREVEVYFEEETKQGVFLKKWTAKEREIRLFPETDAKEIQALQEWTGSLKLPDELYVAKEGSNVLAYQEQYGLDFTEAFWITGERLMLQLEIKIENGQGESLYYGRVPDTVKNNLWCMEAGTRARSDSKGMQYRILGGETAVIYPGETSREDYVIHGIY